MNQPYARVNQPYATLTLASALREMFGVQLYKNNARALLSRILSILNLDWLQHARSVRRVYEICIKTWTNVALCRQHLCLKRFDAHFDERNVNARKSYLHFYWFAQEAVVVVFFKLNFIQISVPTILNSQTFVVIKTRFRLSYLLTQPRLTVKCDMIKGNELDVGNIDFELQA